MFHWIALALLMISPAGVSAAPTRLGSLERIEPHNVTAELDTMDGTAALRVRIAPTVRPGSQTVDTPTFALIRGTEGFRNGTVEVSLWSDLLPNAPPGARGFVGLAFRITPDGQAFEAIYLRPANGRADDQVRRNHTTQYMSFPGYDFPRLRAEAPEKYESYVDIALREWIRMRIEVDGARARLFVNDATQPTLIVDDLKRGPDATGPIGLWVYNGTLARFRDLRITPR